MKTKVLKYSLYMLLVLGQLGAWAKGDSEVTKTISKSYKVDEDTRLSIRNSFGRVHIDNWDKMEFSIEIEMIGRGSNDDRAQRMLDRIEIDISESSDGYAFITKLDDMKSKNNDGFEVNYTVKMPVMNPLRVKHSFGDLYLPDRDGPATIDVSYGALKARNFNARAEIEVQFGRAVIGTLTEAEVIAKYTNDMEIETAEILELDQQFSDVEIESVTILDLESKYGSVEIGDAGEIEADVGFTNFKIDRLSVSLDMDGNYVSGFEIDQVAPDFDFIYISGDFGSYELGIDPATQADFEGRFRFCDLKTQGVDIDFHYRVKEQNEAEYRGKIGGGDSNRKIRVSSSYGNLILRN